MTQPSRLEIIFAGALAADSGPARERFLDQSCANDPELRQRVEKMLAAHDLAGSFLERPAITLDTAPLHGTPISESPGTVIGPYKLLQQIGEGGMGTVFMAEQSQPIQRIVAVKIMKPGLETRQVIARFEAERQALALMDHPNVARVLDAGTTASGRPYFVMELVKGIPITQYCDEHRLPLRKRLELLIPVCQAVQHAHQKGIIHRDLKPTNILVAEYDELPVPKVIDFGVAKATAHRLTDRTLFTEFGQVMGTIEYMSPEQAKFNQLDIDTRSDIYSLGVLLYELLTGTTPIERKRLKQAAFDEMLRMIREEEPPKPSTRLSTAETLPQIAEKRNVDSPKLNRLVRGELDWIVMKALEKDRNRRYETANGLGMDIQRYLDGQAVLAAPPTARYLLTKFARRHHTALATSLAFAALLVGLSAVSIWQALRASRAEVAAVKDKTAAEANAAETAAALEFVEKRIFSAARPAGLEGGLGHEVTLRRAIEESVPWVEKSFKDQPLIEARLRRTIGLSLEIMGDPKGAFDQYQRAVDLSVGVLGSDHLTTIKAKGNLANTYQYLGRQQDALKLREEIRASLAAQVGPEEDSVLANMNNLANSYEIVGRRDEGLKMREELYAIRQKVNGPDHKDTLMAMANLAVSYTERGRDDEAFKLRETVLARCRQKFGEKHPTTLEAMNGMASSLDQASRFDEALSLREQALAGQREVLGIDHTDTLATMSLVARSYESMGRYQEAVELGKEAIARLREKVGASDDRTVNAIGDLANAYDRLGDQKSALPLREEVYAMALKVYGPDSDHTLMAKGNLAVSYYSLGRDAEGLKMREEVVAGYKARPNFENRASLVAIQNLALSYSRTGRTAEAITQMEHVVARFTALYGENDGDRLVVVTKLATCLLEDNRQAEGVAMLEDALPRQRKVFGNNGFDTMMTMRTLAEHYAKVARIDEAQKLYEELLPLHVGVFGRDHMTSINIMSSLALIHNGRGQWDDSIKLNVEVAERLKALKGIRDPQWLLAQDNLGKTLARAERYEEAHKVYETLIPLQREILGDKHLQTLNAMLYHGNVLNELGRKAEGLKVWEEAYPLQKAAFGPDNGMCLATVHNIADAYAAKRDFKKSIPLRQDMLPREIKTLGVKHEYTLRTMFALTGELEAVGRQQDALAQREKCLVLIRNALGPADPLTFGMMNDLARSYERVGRSHDALRVATELKLLTATPVTPLPPSPATSPSSQPVALPASSR